MPIYQTATFRQTDAMEMGAYDYTRSGNPTRSQLGTRSHCSLTPELHLAKIMAAERAFCVTSGMAALDVITRCLQVGDEVITGEDLYGGTHRLLTHLQTINHLTVHHVDTTDIQQVLASVTENTKMVLLETPTNPMMRIADIRGIADGVHAIRADIWVVVDNTMMSPYLQQPLLLGADIVYHSGTKFLSGHHDLMAGVLACRDTAITKVPPYLHFLIVETGVYCECDWMRLGPV
jgi:cystathionine beta-lyase